MNKLILYNFEENLEKYNLQRKPTLRYSSFDYCHNYFRSFYESGKLNCLCDEDNIEKSCLHLGFYLASWGMMRGSSFLLNKSLKYFNNLIITISKLEPILWEIDVDNYDEKNIQLIINCKQKIIDAFGKENKPSDTLISKIMLGVFGNVPAYDNNFKKFLKSMNCCQTFSKKSLRNIKNIYDVNFKEIDKFAKNAKTLDFNTGKETRQNYTKAKIIDMYGFNWGKN